jgi:hypothetical protein
MSSLLPVSALSLTLLLAPWTGVLAQACSKQSPAHTVALLELYTSEGCDSCPPADRFVSGLRSAGLTAAQVVPLSLHVDYWDYIGWKDIFARPAFTQRQRWLAQLASSHTVYTPEIFISGRELRNWRNGVPAAVERINTMPAQASIKLNVGVPANGSLPIDVDVRAASGSKLFVALYENGLSSDVRAGENRGVTLRHDYVVRDWVGPVAVNADGKQTLPRVLSLPTDAAGKNLGVAAFVQDDKGAVLQALALPLCGS